MKTIHKRLVALLLAIFMLASLCGCSSPTKEAEATVSCMFDAFKQLDLEKAQNYIDVNEMKLNEVEEDETTNYDLFMKTLFDRLDYTIISSEEVDPETVNVVVAITAIDMKPVFAEYVVAALQYAFANAFADPQPTEEETNKKMEELFIASATKEGLATVTNEVTVKVVKKDSNWKVVAEDELVDAMFGGLIAAAQAIEDSFNDIE
jgi:hypothetical protein